MYMLVALISRLFLKPNADTTGTLSDLGLNYHFATWIVGKLSLMNQ